MFKKLRCKKGAVPIALWTYMLWFMFGVSATAILFREPHITKRAIERCVDVDGGEVEECTEIIGEWTQDEKIEYIRDNLTENCHVNFENGSCG